MVKKSKKTVGIIMAGGSGTRLSPTTKVINKHLIPIYDKPMIFYPLSTLMLSQIRDIMIICAKKDIPFYNKLLGNGNHLGLNLTYQSQDKPSGIAEGINIGKRFISNNNVCLILGDNFFYGQGLSNTLINAKDNLKGATIFAYKVKDPSNYGVVNIKNNKIVSIVEKPKSNISNFAVTGIYFYNSDVLNYFKKVAASKRNELEITSINNMYLRSKKLNTIIFNRGITWLDCGTPDNLLEASRFVQIIEQRQGYKIGCLEEIAWRNKWITSHQLKKIASGISDQIFSKYLISLLD